MAIVKEDITNLKTDIQNLHTDLKQAMDHLEYHLGVKRMDEADLNQMSKHLTDIDSHMATLVAHANSLEEKHA
ncbi:hypothetical protein ACFL3U_00610 [Pseudomonadota bacterium]